MKILYIDDLAHWREALEEAFTRAGAEIMTLPDARGDIVKIAFQYQPDLILLDFSMPEVNGFDALSILKNDERTKKFPVFFFSNMGFPEYVQRAIDLGAEQFLDKREVEPDQVVKICSEYLATIKK